MTWMVSRSRVIPHCIWDCLCSIKQCFSPFSGFTQFHCMQVPSLVHPFTHQWTFFPGTSVNMFVWAPITSSTSRIAEQNHHVMVLCFTFWRAAKLSHGLWLNHFIFPISMHRRSHFSIASVAFVTFHGKKNHSSHVKLHLTEFWFSFPKCLMSFSRADCTVWMILGEIPFQVLLLIWFFAVL